MLESKRGKAYTSDELEELVDNILEISNGVNGDNYIKKIIQAIVQEDLDVAEIMHEELEYWLCDTK